ncbi:2-phospho-L-lactate guanylyltransferase [Haloactinomyces albus]|uniref:Phosphoenolpyruvate guanylyltransferase n=1 Tax=Haloactinomyces albus TaxID=1352928 RepID=A0AAE3ZCU8_9ACTN|nr:2-phospho-L-lactate guanylyltransferase [Haloactinomyces albus]MDR7300764.1 2-phospho-L-lactate guanylyltransferase [Haloactinomyces albus]
MTAGLHLLVPIKPLHLAKSRLLGALEHTPRRSQAHAALVTAVALDTVSAARGAAQVREVVAVTSDPELTAALRALGIGVLPDSPSAGLNAALRHADGVLRQGSAGMRVGALQADLPALRPDDLSAALEAAGDRRAFCPDRQGTGTTLLLAERDRPLDPRFGPDSAATHGDSGAVRLKGPWESLRCDVDTGADLRRATELGLGTHTRAHLAEHCSSGAAGR